jgi:hypothetical protein
VGGWVGGCVLTDMSGPQEGKRRGGGPVGVKAVRRRSLRTCRAVPQVSRHELLWKAVLPLYLGANTRGTQQLSEGPCARMGLPDLASQSSR